MSAAKTLRRFGRGSTDEERRNFGRDLLEALDLLGIGPGENFVVSHWPAGDLPLPDPTENSAGGARSTDPATAKAAAVKVYPRSGSQRHRILIALAEAGQDRGANAQELVEATGIEYRSCTPRIGELKNGGWVVAKHDPRSGEVVTRKTTMGAEAEVLILTARALFEMPKNDLATGVEQ